MNRSMPFWQMPRGILFVFRFEARYQLVHFLKHLGGDVRRDDDRLKLDRHEEQDHEGHEAEG